jgi:hypothetical protein
MKTDFQKGGLIIKTSPEEAIIFFIENCAEVTWLKSTSNSASGVIFECTLKDGVESPYEMIRSTNFKSPVKKILIKIVGIRSEVRGEYDDNVWTVPFKTVSPPLAVKNLEKEETFTTEINVQTDIFLKTISYLNPLCPAPIYASIKKDKANAIEFMSKLKIPDKYGFFSNATNRLITVIIEKITSGSIPYLGVLGMEIADDYKTFYDLYHNGITSDADIRIYENMIRLKIIDLALKTGYSQGDFHTGNMLVNPSVTGYYNGISGNALIIDFGYANKIPSEKLQEIKHLVSENKFAEALKIFNTLVRSDNLPLSENPEVYGWVSYNYDNKSATQIELENPEEIAAENQKLIALKQAEEEATDARIAFYNDSSHSGERDIFPLLPLSNAIKNSLFEGLLSGGKKKRKTKSRKNPKKNPRKSTKKYEQQKRRKTRRHLR